MDMIDALGAGAAERVIIASEVIGNREKRAGPDQKTGVTIGGEAPRAATTRVDPEDLKRAVAEANDTLRPAGRHLEFSTDQGTKTIVVKLIDEQSGEVIRQFPPKEILRIRAYYRDLQGLLVNRAV